jgi:two-component sensor histidine kinase
VRCIDGSVGWTFARAVPLLDEAGEITEWFGAASDVTARKETEEHLRLVINELNHRVKNTLAMMQAIADQTFKGSGDLGVARAKFAARIKALASASDLLTGEHWVGASLHQTAERVLAPYVNDAPNRAVIRGPEVLLTPKSAISFSMALHELATNATKHGAWSVKDGRVILEWEVIPEGRASRLRLEWRETDGPAVVTPVHRGFGSRLIERGLAAELGGKATLNFEPEGLVCIVDAPLNPYNDEEK